MNHDFMPVVLQQSLLIFFIALLFWHLSEFLIHGYIHKKYALSGFLISKPYLFALALALIEFYTEAWFFSEWKRLPYPYIMYIGTVGIIIAEVIRITAFYDARTAFTHYVQSELRKDHTLITKGIYCWSRHPGYIGWYLWSISTQILLFNPFCFVLYSVWNWIVLNQRIRDEEKLLFKFFGETYEKYRKSTPIRIPFMH